MTQEQAYQAFRKYQTAFAAYTAANTAGCADRYTALQAEVVRRELCVGSDLFLGYYCPSPVFELIVGNTHRGKILRRVTKRSVPTHEYGFGGNGRLLTIRDHNNSTYCFCEYEGDIIRTVCFRNLRKPVIEYLVEYCCDPQGRITRYTLACMSGTRCTELNEEIYTYGDRGMNTVVMWRCMPVPNRNKTILDAFAQHDSLSEQTRQAQELMHRTGCIIDVDRYRLIHDDEGVVTGYQAMDSDFWQEHIFEIAKSKQKRI